ncbi:hypothetical protein ACU6T4_11260 [Avibacterium paragallinarum]|uniref:hypothetical protein n=1 Tax=Avibacterium paragallinarum TaxID=728 RepID=UPI00021ACF93|nr:hypothetical protein [Avibacterium paragallinarum]AZI13574.1 hypothetical protein EIA51_02315 [Avibacterium paragallinarum]QIR12111.1 hypothetical protein HBL79_07625 [Avibacterium paragallinarum]QJE09069.1 hypothetical protein HHJ62_01425 [Avibacterium paragallinarum]QJE11265.1 hypothetical protein HHJ61_01425 [Avibacterium paragallinarum]QJE13462.1 hypothetical protein HHJ60_01430 [Avibacterium paragallinarum]
MVITNETEFLDYISSIIIDEGQKLNSKDFELPNIEFNGYPNLFFNVKGSTYSSTLTTPLLNALSELILEIQKSYCLIKYETSNLQRLTLEDRKNIDIIFKIKEGSSEGESDNTQIANGIFSVIKDGMVGMNGWQKLAVLVTFLGIIGGLGYKWLDNQAIEQATSAATINNAITALSDTNKQAFELLKERGKTEISNEIELHSEQAQAQFFKEVAKDPNAEQATLNQITADRTLLDDYKKRTSKHRTKTPKVDWFMIKGIELYAPQYIETDIDVSVIRESDDTEFTLSTSLTLMSDEELSALKDALGTNNLVKIAYEELKENGKITKSQFVRIEQ